MAKIPKPTNLMTVGSWNVTGELSGFVYRNGYFNAAELLADAIEKSEVFDTRVLSIIYPALHLYRHFVELTLKDFVDLAVFVGPYVDLYDADQVKGKRDRLSHDLRKAYDVVRSIIGGIYNGTPDSAMQIADDRCLELVEWFHDRDKRGDSFRYTLNLKAEAQFPDSFPVDLHWLRSCVRAFDLYMHEEYDTLRSYLDPEADDMGDRISMAYYLSFVVGPPQGNLSHYYSTPVFCYLICRSATAFIETYRDYGGLIHLDFGN